MNIELDTAFTALSAKIGRAFHRYGFIVIFLIVSAGIAVSLFVLNGVIMQTDDPGNYTPNAGKYEFDNETIEKIEKLKDSNESTDKIDSSGVDRLLPF